MTDRNPKSTDAEGLDRLLERDRPEPGPDFDARFFERLAAVDAAGSADDGGALDALLDPVVGADRPEPGPDFDARFFERLAEVDSRPDADGALDALLDPVVGADRPAPGPDFDRRVTDALRAEAPARPSTGARILRFVRRPAVLPLLAAAAMLVAWVLSRPPTEPPENDLELLGHLELLEVYDELEVLDGIADEETFELVAMLHTLDDEEARP